MTSDRKYANTVGQIHIDISRKHHINEATRDKVVAQGHLDGVGVELVDEQVGGSHRHTRHGTCCVLVGYLLLVDLVVHIAGHHIGREHDRVGACGGRGDHFEVLHADGCDVCEGDMGGALRVDRRGAQECD